MHPFQCRGVLRALADETRWQTVQILLAEEKARVTDLAERLNIPQPAMSKHLRILRDAGIVGSEKEGTVVWCRIAPDMLEQLRGEEKMLDIGCCAFRFNHEA